MSESPPRFAADLRICQRCLQVEDLVTVKGEYGKVIDLGVSSRCLVPLAPREPVLISCPMHDPSLAKGGTHTEFQSAAGFTSFLMRLEPAEGTVLKLVR